MSESPTTALPAVGPPRGPAWTLVNVLLASLVAVIAFVVYYVPALSGRPLSDTPEARVAVGAREMLESGDWVLPTQAGEPRVKKPPLPYWLAALACKITGGNPADNAAMTRAVLLPPALNGALAVFLVALFGCALFGRTAGMIAAMILGSSHLIASFAQTGFGDSTLMLACGASACGGALLLSEKPRLSIAVFAALALAAGILTKGHIPIVLLALPLGVEAFLRRKTLRWIHAAYVGLAFVLALLIAAPWFVLVERKHPGAFNEMTAEAKDAIHHTEAPSLPETNPAPHVQNDPFAYYFHKAALGLMPWTPLLLIAVLLALDKAIGVAPLPQRVFQAARFLTLYAGLGFLIFLIVQKKQHHYLLPLIPALALAAGTLLARFNVPGGVREERMGWAQLGIGLAGALFICCAPWWPAIVTGLQDMGFHKASHLSSLAAEFSGALGWLLVPLALAFFIANFFCMRLWVQSRGIVAVSIWAAAMAVALIWVVFRPAESARRDAVWANIHALRQETDKLGPNARLYVHGPNEALMIFFTGKKVRELRDLPNDAATTGSRAAVLLQGKSTSELKPKDGKSSPGKEPSIFDLYGINLGSAARHLGEGYYLVPLSSELEAQLRKAITEHIGRPAR